MPAVCVEAAAAAVLPFHGLPRTTGRQGVETVAQRLLTAMLLLLLLLPRSLLLLLLLTALPLLETLALAAKSLPFLAVLVAIVAGRS